MNAIFSDEFKQQTVQKLLTRSEGITNEDIVTPLGVSMASINRWTTNFRCLHSRSRLNEEIRLNTRSVSDENANLALKCLWFVLFELGWAKDE